MFRSPHQLEQSSGNINCGNVSESYNTVMNNYEVSLTTDDRQILEWLSPLAPRERHQDIRTNRLEGVGEWLLKTDEFMEWKNGEDGTINRTLFCHGDPGVGKTFISSLVVDTLLNQSTGDNIIVACFYCDFQTHKEQSITRIFGTLLKQLVSGFEQIPGDIANAFKRAKKELDGRGLQLSDILKMLINCLKSLRRSFICIDAMDECPIEHRPELLRSLKQIMQESPRTRLFLTGRPYVKDGIERCFAGAVNSMRIKPTPEDIIRYLVMRLEMDPVPEAMDENLRVDIMKSIPELISDIFLLVSLNVNAILAQATIYERRKQLDKMKKGLGLEDAYTATLTRIMEQTGNKATLGMGVLMWIVHSERPLKVDELCSALAVEMEDKELDPQKVPAIQTLLGCSLGLVDIDSRSTVRLVHFSLQEYLRDHRDHFGNAHPKMAEVCLTYLHFRSIKDLSPALSTRPPTSSLPPTAHFLNYASLYWGAHAKRDITESVKLLALQLLDRYECHISAKILLDVDEEIWTTRGSLSKGPVGFTGIHGAAYLGIDGLLAPLSEMKSWDINGLDFSGSTPLMWAAAKGNERVVRWLLGWDNINPNLGTKLRLSLLDYAHLTGERWIKLELYLGYGDVVSITDTHASSLSPLMCAAGGGYKSVVNLLLERNDVKPNQGDMLGRTALSWAVVTGDESMVQFLLSRERIDPHRKNIFGQTELSHAALQGNTCIVELLLECQGIDSNSADKNGLTLLSHAARSGHEDVVRLLLKRQDVNADAADNKGRTPLSYAARSGHEDVVRLLLERQDVNADAADNEGRTPLSYAASGYATEGVVRLLLEKQDVNADAADNEGRTPLSHAASSYNNEGVVRLLLERQDVNADAADNEGRTPLSYASSGYATEGVVRLLLERQDVNVDAADIKGRTPLSYAAGSNWRKLLCHLPGSSREDVVRLLLERQDVNADAADNEGRTPFSHAESSGNEDVMRLLQERQKPNPAAADDTSRAPLSHAISSGNEPAEILPPETKIPTPPRQTQSRQNHHWTTNPSHPRSYQAPPSPVSSDSDSSGVIHGANISYINHFGSSTSLDLFCC